MDTIKLWLDFGMAWLAVVFAIMLSVVYILRLLKKKENRYTLAIKKMNAALRRHHKAMGVALVIFGLVHGLFSSESVFTLNIGTVSLVVSILLGVNWMIRKRLSKHKGWMYYHRILTVAFLLLIVWHVVDVGGIQAPEALFGYGLPPAQTASPAPMQTSGAPATAQTNDLQTENAQAAQSAVATALATKQFAGAKLKDGTFTGEATGFNPGLQVSVVVKDNAVVSVTVTNQNEDNVRYYGRAIAAVPQEIVDNQTTDVDTVTSATFTSTGIINAVNDALSKALVSGTLPPDKQLPARRGR